MKKIVFISLLLACKSFSEDFDDLLATDLGQPPPIMQNQEPLEIEPSQKECRCQCLSKTLTPQNELSFPGVWQGDNCVCSCLKPKCESVPKNKGNIKKRKNR